MKALRTFAFALLIFGLSVVCPARLQTPEPPKGYVWKELSEIKGACLCPKKWSLVKTSTEGALVYKLAPPTTKDEQEAETGLSITIIQSVAEKHKVSAQIYTLNHLLNLAPIEDSLVFSDAKSDGKLQIRSAELEEKKTSRHILLKTIANMGTDTVYIIAFSTPAEKWGDYEQMARTMIGLILIDDEW